VYSIIMTRFLLDSGDPNEYRQIAELAKQNNTELWGSTTNPTLIAKKLTGQKVSFEQAFYVLQKQIVEEILQIVPGAVSAEVYASHNTTAQEMIEQGKQIAAWDPRVVVKLPTTIEGFKARTELRKLGICINNTLVFSQQQVFAIDLHEKILIEQSGKPKSSWPCFISPFIGRLDDQEQDGLSMLEHSVIMTRKFFEPDQTWMLEASVRSAAHMKKGIDLDVELLTAPAKVYAEWLTMPAEQRNSIETTNTSLQPIPDWQPAQELLTIATVDDFMHAITKGLLDITHPLTDKGIDRFASDWASILVEIRNKN